MIYIFNELSLTDKVTSVQAAQAVMKSFVKSCVKAKELGMAELRLNEQFLTDLYQISIHPEYNIDNWLNDTRVEEDLRYRFRDIVANSPLIKNDEIQSMAEYSNSSFYKLLAEERLEVRGLGAAHMLGGLAISLATHAVWDNEEVEIIHYSLSDQLEETNLPVIVKHFSSPVHLLVHAPWIERLKEESLGRSEELWERRQEFFPNLVLCGKVEEQLKNVGMSKTLNQIIDRLRVLDIYVGNWREGRFNHLDVIVKTNLDISPESETTINKFGAERKFEVPGQGKRLFNLHVKTGILRIYIYPDEDARRVYVGYIGKHLRISSQG